MDEEPESIEVTEVEEDAPRLDPEAEARRVAAMSFIRKLGDPVLKSSATPVEDMSRVWPSAAPASSSMHIRPVRIRAMVVRGQGWDGSEAGEYPRMPLSRKVSLRVPTEDRPLSSTCSKTELSLSPVRFEM